MPSTKSALIIAISFAFLVQSEVILSFAWRVRYIVIYINSSPPRTHSKFANSQRDTTNLAKKTSYQENTSQNFPTQKIPKIENFKPPKILRSSWSLEIWSTPPRPPELKLQKVLNKRDFYTVNVWKIQISRRTLVQSAYHCWKIFLSVY